MSKKYFNLLLVIYLSFIVIGVFLQYITNTRLDHAVVNAIFLKSSDFRNGPYDMSYRILDKNDSPIQIYKAVISKDTFNKLPADYLKIIMRHVSCQAYNIYFNGFRIGSTGDFDEGRSNIWFSMNSFDLDKRFISDKNLFTIETFCIYDVGLSNQPILITTSSEGNKLINLVSITTSWINNICIGFAFFGAVLIFFLYLHSKCKKRAHLYFSLALLLTSVHFTDYLQINYLPVSYLIYKKIIILALYFSISFVSAAIGHILKSRLNTILAYASMAISVLIVIFATDMITFKKIYNYCSIIIVINILCWLIASVRNFKPSYEARIFFTGGICLLFYSVYCTWSAISGQSNTFNAPLFCITIFAIIPVFYVFTDFDDKNRQLAVESQKRDMLYNESIRDGLTGLYNRNYIIPVLNRLEPPFCLAMLDIDDFKHVNDTYGHMSGDLIIRHAAEILKKKMRYTDYVCRYGGDEFLVILLDCNAENAKKVLTNATEEIEKTPVEIDHNSIAITMSVGICPVADNENIGNIIDNADHALYYSKRHGKNQVNVYTYEGL